MDEPFCVVGLGNPGAEYAGTRHNAGALVADVLAARLGGRFSGHRSRADVLSGRLGSGRLGSGVRVVLAKPRSYMNESGGPVRAVCDFYKITPDRLVVVHDELDIGFGVLRLKLGGGDNGHNGLRSVTRSLGTGDYHRVRFGIGRPPGRQDPADYVLRDFSTAERRELPLLLDRAADAVETLLAEGLAAAQNAFHAS